MSRIQQVCILGGGGFVGRTLVQQLADSGRQVTVLSRRPERRRHLLTTPGVKLVKANVHQPAELEKYFAGMDAVINLIGILNEFRYQRFRDVHVKLPGDIMRACWKAGVPRLMHMSALNADAGTGMSEYLRTKGEAEQLLHVDSGDDLQVTRFRPSVIFGPHDQFFNRFAALLKFSPGIFLLAAGKAKLSPVYVGDVARAFVRTLEDKSSYDQRYDLCGPREYTLEELVNYTAKLVGLNRQVISLGNRLSMLQAFFLGMAPGKPFTLDNYHSLQTTGGCKNDGLSRLGIHKTPLEAVVPSYLCHRHERARYDGFRRQASRDIDWF
jgi:NADH dehydrogenase